VVASDDIAGFEYLADGMLSRAQSILNSVTWKLLTSDRSLAKYHVRAACAVANCRPWREEYGDGIVREGRKSKGNQIDPNKK
jgi:hypothetical protein